MTGHYFKEIDEELWEDENSNTEYFYSCIRIKYGDHYQDIAIDSSTLSIHFKNMIDTDGKKIFASLSEDGMGGDILYRDSATPKYMPYLRKDTMTIDDMPTNTAGLIDTKEWKITGIQK